MLISLIVTLVILGLAFWLVSLIPLEEPFGKIIKVVFIVIAVLVVLEKLGVYSTGLV